VCSISALAQNATEGTLYAVGKKGVELGACPLKNTKVSTDISGFMARVKVVQEFENTFGEPIEAVYTFPLSQTAAVDDMTMLVGARRIRAKILKREEARQIYEAAKSEGKTAGLLDQERPNVFTQSVANILPGEKIIIEISYVETLKYEDGVYEFVFPMTVGPRYIPASVKDASKISPPVAKARAGHDVSIDINLNAGVPIEEIRSGSHKITTMNLSANSAKIVLKNETTIPNKDFILRYDVTGKRIEDAILTHRDERGGFFSLILQPPDKFASEDVTPKEIVFVLDTSGSMHGFPIEKAKEAMKLSLDGLYPNDTFNLITFAGDTSVLFDAPVPATRANLDKAQAFLDTRQGGGGTEMMKAIKAALEPSDSQTHLRIVCFMTDGYVGNEGEIIAEIQKHPNARVFSFGIGSSVNRFLLDKMAEEGRGEVEYVALDDDGSKAARKFYERVRTPLLTDVSVDWNGLPIADVYPNRIADLFSAKPVILHGRYTKAASGTIKLRGKVSGRDYVREIPINFPESESKNDVIATLWARTRIDDLTKKDYKGVADGNALAEVQQTITNIGLEYRLLTQFTSFVAVEERIVNQNGQPTRVEVPVELPQGVNRQTTLGESNEVVTVNSSQAQVNISSQAISSLPVNGRSTSNLMGMTATATVDVSSSKSRSAKSKKSSGIGSGRGSGQGSGSGSGYGSGSAAYRIDGASGSENTFVIDGQETANFRTGAVNNSNSAPKIVSGGVINGRATNLPKPEFPAAARAVNASGAVSVQISIDESGNVISAQAVSGHPLLRQAAESAANNAKFAPTLVSGKSVKISGVIVYNFPGGSYETSTKIGRMSVKPLSPEEKRNIAFAEKLHFWIYSLVERRQKGESKLAENDAKFVSGGNARIKVILNSALPETAAKLKNLGFTATVGKNPKVLNGVISVEKLIDLAEIAEVQYVLPQIE
jgi:Ca-activated chloride channel family protein